MVAKQASAVDLTKVLYWADARFNVVIDDGSHVTADQIFTARNILPHMAQDGVYVIEDVQEPEKVVAELGAGLIARFNKRADDTLVVISK